MIADILENKTIKAKEQAGLLGTLLLNGKISERELIAHAKIAKDPVKATCLEAFEYAGKTAPGLVTKEVFLFSADALAEKAPRIKWESAKIIGNTVAHHTALIDRSLKGLLDNAEHSGTVVRWSAAYAVGEIVKLKTRHNKELIPAVEAICKHEKKASIRKIYEAALKKAKAL